MCRHPAIKFNETHTMRKVIAAMNMTVDGVCDHTAGIADEELHQHYTQLLGQGDAILYGRTTYHLMEFWRTFLENPSDEKSMNDFAHAIDKIPKIVFSRTLRNVDWKTATIATRNLKDEVLELKKQSGKDVLVGSPSLITQLMQLNLLDELQLCIHPVVAGNGMLLFDKIKDRTLLKLAQTKTFRSGSVVFYYQPEK